jgi:beta-lactamase class A
MISLLNRGLAVSAAMLVLAAGTACSSDTTQADPQQLSSTPLPTATESAPSRAAATFSTSARDQLGQELSDDLGTNAARFSLSVRDLTTGTSYTYHSGIRVATASIIKVEFLIGLLLKAQKEGRGLTTAEKDLAQPMIHVSSNEAATSIFNEIGGYSGFNAVSRKLGLKNTRPAAGGWGTTTTSAQDQIRVLNALTSSRSPLTAASRRYVLGLMDNVASDENWGVSAASAPGETFAVKVGLLSRTVDDDTWIVNCIGRVVNGGHTFVIAAVSDHNVVMQGGEDRIEDASKLTVSAMLKAER